MRIIMVSHRKLLPAIGLYGYMRNISSLFVIDTALMFELGKLYGVTMYLLFM